MPKSQNSPLAPPSQEDIESLKDYTAKIQESFDEIYQSLHDHTVRTSDPGREDGTVGDIVLVDDGTNKYLAIRYADGWFKTANLIAI